MFLILLICDGKKLTSYIGTILLSPILVDFRMMVDFRMVAGVRMVVVFGLEGKMKLFDPVSNECRLVLTRLQFRMSVQEWKMLERLLWE